MEKMKANLAIAILHEPEILYLDETTIGLDIVSKDKMRKFIRDINHEKQTTVILTTYYVEEIRNSIILIENGAILFDGSKEDFKLLKPAKVEIIIDYFNDVTLKKSDTYEVV